MDGSSRYNQIKNAPEDEIYTTFRTPIKDYALQSKVLQFNRSVGINEDF